MPGKISIIGAGNVGSATAFALAMDGTADEIVLFDCNVRKAEGEIMDIEHASSFMPHTEFNATERYEDISDSDIVIITAGARQEKGETRLDLLEKNVTILHSIIVEVVKEAPNAILIIVSNPVDVLTYFAQKFSGFPRERVIGTGTVLDTARFKSFIAKKFHVNAHNVHALILGEHGDSSFPVISNAHIESIPLKQFPGYSKKIIEQLHKKVVNAAYEVIARKGATNLAIGMCVLTIVRAILKDSHEILPVSSVLKGEYGLRNVAISTPSILGRTGIQKELELPLSASEKKALHASATILKNAIASQQRKKHSPGVWCPRE